MSHYVRKLFTGATIVAIPDLLKCKKDELSGALKELEDETRAIQPEDRIYSFKCNHADLGTLYLLANSQVSLATLTSFLQTNQPRWEMLSNFKALPQDTPGYVMPSSIEAKVPLEEQHKQICASLSQPEL
jgi:hypothetical protein